MAEQARPLQLRVHLGNHRCGRAVVGSERRQPGFAIIMLLFGFLLYYKKDKEKNTEKVGAIRKSGQEKKMWKKRKRSRNKKEGEFKIEAAPSDDSDPEEIEA